MPLSLQAIRHLDLDTISRISRDISDRNGEIQIDCSDVYGLEEPKWEAL